MNIYPEPTKTKNERGGRLKYLLRRGTAYVLDVAGLAILVVVTQGLWRWATAPWLPAPATGLEVEAWVLLSVSLPVWLYFSLLESSAAQATLGKRLLGLRVERQHGGRLTWGQALARTALKLLPWELTHVTLLLPTPIWADPQAGFRPGFVIVYGLLAAYLAAAALTPRRQTLPDLATGTVVIETKETAE
jgi:uncharacterized RDD family membrane protein YckC